MMRWILLLLLYLVTSCGPAVIAAAAGGGGGGGGGGATGNENEPNDTFAQAADFGTLNVTATITVTGTVEGSDVFDFSRYTAGFTGMVQILATPADAARDLDVFLNDESGNILQSFQAGTSASGTFNVTAGDVFLLTVAYVDGALDGSAPLVGYTLTVSGTPSGTNVPEVEPNGLPGSATNGGTLNPGSPIIFTGTIDGQAGDDPCSSTVVGEIDFFSFTASQTGMVSVVLNPINGILNPPNSTDVDFFRDIGGSPSDCFQDDPNTSGSLLEMAMIPVTSGELVVLGVILFSSPNASEQYTFTVNYTSTTLTTSDEIPEELPIVGRSLQYLLDYRGNIVLRNESIFHARRQTARR